MKKDIPLEARGSLSVPEFCEWSGLGPTHVFALIKAGKLRATKVGRRTIIAMPEAKRFLSVGGAPDE